MTNSTAYLLVSHGSRDLRPQIAMSNLAEIIRQKIRQKYVVKQIEYNHNSSSILTKIRPVLVGTASLELTVIPLHQNIIKFAKSALNVGIKNIKIVPLFLLPGVHVCEDIPLEIALAQQELGEKVQLNLEIYLGGNLAIKELLQEEFTRLNCEGKIILAHGSKRQDSNQIIEDIALDLSATTAYWTLSPNLETQVIKLVDQGRKKIAIVPYFLFTGGITEIITQQVETLQIKYPQITIKLGNTLEKNPNLVELIIETLER